METLSAVKVESWLVWFLRGVLIFGTLILFVRLVDLQLIRGKYFKALSEGNRIRRVPIVAPRGLILARGGEVLAGAIEVKKRIIFEPVGGFRKEDIKDTSNSQDVFSEWLRQYPLGESFAHVSGYLGEVSTEELGKVRAGCPEKGPRKLGFWVGRGGLEQEYDCLLSGIDGEELVEVDARGAKIRVLGRKKAISGENLKTTIDWELQQKVAELFRGKRGAVVVTDSSGEILALYSSPSFDPNAFIDRNQAEKVVKILGDREMPLFNRAISGIFHPGSTFKPIVAVAALEEGVIDPSFTYEDTGSITLDTAYGRFSYSNWYFTQYGATEGKIGLARAITRSVDTFFYKLGELLGVEKIKKWAHQFNLDQKTGVDLPGEAAGLVPDPSWKLETKGERWFLGNTYHLAIGQGDVALTPIAVNTAIATIAASGKYCTPHILSKELVSGNFQFPSAERRDSLISNFRCSDLEIKKETIDLVKRGMVEACSQGGTGFTFFDFKEKTGIQVGCKTGTAETEKDEPHAWFTAFAPAEEPEIIATVLVENGGEGSRVAGPIAREIFNYWFENKKLQN